MVDATKITELDPIFMKAIKLLHSKSKDSADKLKELLDTAIQQRRSELKIRKSDYEALQNRSKNLMKKDIRSRKRDSSTNSEKISIDDQSIDDMPPLKKFRPIETNHQKDENNLNNNDLDPNKFDLPELLDVMSSSSDADLSDRSSGLIYDEQFDLDLDNLSCIICKDWTVTASNRLVECQECHNLYHQECHQPKVVDDVNDPRFVWYCNKCSKNMKKILATKPIAKKITKPILASETSVIKPFEIVQPFKRIPDVSKVVSIVKEPGLSGKPVAANAAKISAFSSASDLSKFKPDSNKQPQNKIIKLDAKSTKTEPGVKSFASQLASLTIFPISKTSKSSSNTSTASKLATE